MLWAIVSAAARSAEMVYAECRTEGKAAEARSARELWRRQGRPMLDEPRCEIVERHVARVDAAMHAHEVPAQSAEPFRRRL